MSDPTFSDPFERWHHAWFASPLALDFGLREQPRRFARVRRLFSKSPRDPVSASFLLPPVCLGHLIYLQALDSPILQLGNQDVDIRIPDFLTALRVLRDARWPFTAAIDFTPTHADELLLAAHAKAKMEGAPSPIETALNDQFVPWWLRCHAVPELLDTKGEGMRSLTAPFALTMAVRLLRANFSEERVYTMPLPLLRFYAATISEQDGGASFLTPELAAAMEKARTLQDLTKATLEEQHAIVLAERGPKFADEWIASRREYLRIEAAHGKPAAEAWRKNQAKGRGGKRKRKGRR